MSEPWTFVAVLVVAAAFVVYHMLFPDN
jgi:hypothetical protein